MATAVTIHPKGSLLRLRTAGARRALSAPPANQTAPNSPQQIPTVQVAAAFMPGIILPYDRGTPPARPQNLAEATRPEHPGAYVQRGRPL
jgi:hypothetical protein